MPGAGSPHGPWGLFVVSVGCGSSGLAAMQRKEGFAALACRSAREEQQDCCLGTELLRIPGAGCLYSASPARVRGLTTVRLLPSIWRSHTWMLVPLLSHTAELWPFSGRGAHPWMLGYALCCQLSIKNFTCFLVHISVLCLDPSERERASLVLPVTACSQECLFSIS